MRSTPSLLLLSGPLWPRVVAPYRVLSVRQLEINCCFVLFFVFLLFFCFVF